MPRCLSFVRRGVCPSRCRPLTALGTSGSSPLPVPAACCRSSFCFVADANEGTPDGGFPLAATWSPTSGRAAVVGAELAQVVEPRRARIVVEREPLSTWGTGPRSGRNHPSRDVRSGRSRSCRCHHPHPTDVRCTAAMSSPSQRLDLLCQRPGRAPGTGAAITSKTVTRRRRDGERQRSQGPDAPSKPGIQVSSPPTTSRSPTPPITLLQQARGRRMVTAEPRTPGR